MTHSVHHNTVLPEQHLLDLSQESDRYPWAVLRLLSQNQKEASHFLHSKKIDTYIPLEWKMVEKENGQHTKILRPIVRNLIFAKITDEGRQLEKLLAQAPFPIHMLKKSHKSNEPAKISAQEMYEFQLMCNPEIAYKKFVYHEEVQLRKGTPIYVTHGPLKGLTGKLIRSQKHYFLLKEVHGIAVMVKVSRWCCKPYVQTDNITP